MKMFRVAAGTPVRVFAPDGSALVRPTCRDAVFQREDLVLDPVILHNTPEKWADTWPQLDAIDILLMQGHAQRGECVFHRAGHFMAVPVERVEVL
jgi:hypothetical protein